MRSLNVYIDTALDRACWWSQDGT